MDYSIGHFAADALVRERCALLDGPYSITCEGRWARVPKDIYERPSDCEWSFDENTRWGTPFVRESDRFLQKIFGLVREVDREGVV